MINETGILFRYESLQLNTELKMNNRSMNVKLDTGAESTVICGRNLQLLLGTTPSAIKIPSHYVKRFISASTNQITGHAVVLEHVHLGDYFIEKFPCFVRMDDSVDINLIGMDFIHQCSGTLNLAGDFILSNVPTGDRLVSEFRRLNSMGPLGNVHILFGSPMSYKDLATAIMEDNSLSPSVEEFHSAFKMDDKDFAELLYTVIKDFDVHTLSKFEDVQKDYHVLEKAYRAKGTVHVF